MELVKNNPNHKLKKELIAEFPKKSFMKIQEFLLQWQYRNDPNCINDMINVRLRMSHLTEFKPVSWQPDGSGVSRQLSLF